MKKILKKLFGAKYSNIENILQPSQISEVEFERRLQKNDIDFIIRYLKDGGDINRLMKVYREGREVSLHEYETEKVSVFPLDLVTCQEIKAFMRRHGAISCTEISPEELRRYEEERKSRIAEQKAAEKQRISEEIRKKIKDYESGL